MSDYLVEILLEMKSRGIEQAALVNAAMGALVEQTRKTNLELDSLRDHARNSGLQLRSMGEDISALHGYAQSAEGELISLGNQLEKIDGNTLRAARSSEELGRTLESKLTPAMNNANNSTNNTTNTLYRFVQGLIPGGRTAGNMVIGIVALTVALAPLSAELVASLVLLGAWVVGMTAFLAVVGIVVGGLALLTGGFVALGLAQMGGLDPSGQLEAAQKKLATATNATEAAQETLIRAQTAANSTSQVSANQTLAVTQAQQRLTAAQAAANGTSAASANQALAITQAQQRLAQATTVNTEAQTRLSAAQAAVASSATPTTTQLNALTAAQTHAQATAFAVTQAQEGLTRAQNIASTRAQTNAAAVTAAQDALTRAQNTATASGHATASQTLAVQQAQEQYNEALKAQAVAQNAVNVATINNQGPMATLSRNVEALGKDIGVKSKPFVEQIATTANGLLPVVGPLVAQVMEWFGPRLTLVLDEAVTAFYGFIAAAKLLATGWGQMVDEVLGHPFEYNRIFGAFVELLVQAILGLMKNLVALSDWFIARFPQLQANAQNVFGNLGYLVLGFGTVLGGLVDFILANWSTIAQIFDVTWAVLSKGAPIIRFIADNFGLLVVLVGAVAAGFLVWNVGLAINAGLLAIQAALMGGPGLAAFLIRVIAVTIAMGPLNAATALWNALLLLNPIGLVVIALALLVVGLVLAYQHSETFRKIVDTVFATLVRWGKEALSQYIALGPVIGGFFSAVGTLAQGVIKYVGAFFSELGDGANKIGQALGAGAAAVGRFFSGFGSGVQSALAAIGGFFTNVWNIVTAVGNVIGVVMKAIQTVVVTILAIILGIFIIFLITLWNIISPALEGIRNLWVAVWSAVSAFAQTIWNAVAGFLAAVWTSIYNRAVILWDLIVGFIQSVTNWVWLNVIQPIWNAISSFLVRVWSGIVNFATYWFDLFYGVIFQILLKVWAFLQSIWNTITGFLSSVWSTIVKDAEAGWTSIWGTITSWAGRISSTVQGIWNGMLTSARAFTDSLWNTMKRDLQKVIDILNLFIDTTDAVLKPITGADKTIADIPKLAEGGVMRAGSGGGKVDKVTAVVGEGGGPEYVIPVENKHRGNAIKLWTQAGHDLAMLAGGGVINQGNPYDPNQCTGYVWSRFPGMPVDGNAGDWWANLTSLQHVSSPAPGEIVVYRKGGGYSGYGHVAVVESFMQGNQFLVSEANYKGYGITDQRWSSMADVLGFLNPGVRGSGSPAGNLIGAAIDVIGPLVDGALKAAQGQLSNVPAWLRELPAHLLTTLSDGVKSKYAQLFGGTGLSGAIGPATAAGGNLALWILDALALTGTPTSWSAGLRTLIGRESSGNPNAINLTDINARAGNPSQGLMQLIPSNFNRYHVAGTSGSITDPVANIAAGIQYIKARYGDIFNVQQANPNLPPKGYDAGGGLPPGFGTYFNGTGRTETVTPATTMDRVEALLASIDSRLASLAGQPKANAVTASRRF